MARHQGIRWTYAEFGRRVDELARALMALGVAKGERIGIWSTNRAEWTLTQFATSKLGAILVNVNPSYQASELEYALNQSGCRYLVLTDVFKTTNYNQILESIAPEIATGVPGALKLARVPQLEVVITLGAPRKGMLSWTDVLARAGEVSADALAQRQRELSFDDPINIQYTSGTTGFPKGATLSHHNILNNGYFVARLMNFSDKDRLVIPVPLYHCFGMVMGNLGCITHGATMIYPEQAFDAEAVLRAVAEERATALVRRADDVHCRTGAGELRGFRSAFVAHRHHGRRAVSGRSDAQSAVGDEHARGGDRLRHDGDESGLHANAHRRAPRQAGQHGRSGASARRDQSGRSGDGRKRCRAARSASSARAATA